ncbi:MAG: peptidase M14 [Bacteroidetes bacterium]|nr:peptidase M14 [Bacteroidota bacterium]
MATETFNYIPNPNFPNRYILPKRLENYLQANLSDYISELGFSTNGQKIYKATFGYGTIKILAWSQMHGNESNATHAMLDLLTTLQDSKSLADELWSKISLDFIFMLNPDGSLAWTRRNAHNIDLNRDYNMMSSKEFPLLKKIAMEGNYHYALNLHEQRTLFSTDGIHPATLSFLAPAEDVDRTVTETRKKAMAVITAIVDGMKEFIPNQIARYNDEFYPNSTGDNFTKMGLPTILYEGGHFQNDYLRKETRKYYTIAFYEGLKAIIKLNGTSDGWEKYFELPENKEDHFDIIYRNVSLDTDFSSVVDIAVQYKEQILEGYDEITFLPMVVEVGDCGKKKGWKEIDCKGKKFVSKDKFPKIDEIQNFEIL